ncbi:hypothetical protein [Candidatus Mycobacterium methanotrophicum]|uniref:Low molecular weight antigen MTB12-like C-terminal domain-containing protein n=1 Tax=Candidatus Mycobacterium methanotrophicum TaxID=2943498 RepID=A0ABY4QFU4_9MYCO|nr:hypothetical protein [Candidatus Mycobacterium methanotrophicum]UQX09386.1 hypothetical protein M5I08_13195 [Candidatus Mycobacterium methanotrophicum]
MGRHLTAVLRTAMIMGTVGLSGCSGDEHRASPDTVPPPALTSTAVAQVAPLPRPDALADVLYRLADPSVPGSQKLSLVQGAGPDNAAVLDQFAMALLGGGFAPTTFDVRDVAWSDRDPADVMANVNISSPNRGVPTFSFPMEFTPYQGGWQLSARTAYVLLAFGTDRLAPPASTPGH